MGYRFEAMQEDERMRFFESTRKLDNVIFDRGDATALRFWADDTVASATVPLNSGAAMPANGYGTYRSNGLTLHAGLMAALENGYRGIDTAAMYRNESAIPKALIQSQKKRSDVFITTKLMPADHGTEPTRAAVARSLKELDTTYIDMYLIHAPRNNGSTEEEKQALRLESWLAMEQLHREGVLRSIGVSNFEQSHIEPLLEHGTVVPCVNQIEFHPYMQQHALRDWCHSHRIQVQGYGAIGAKTRGSGVLTDKVVLEIADELDRTPAQITLRYSLQCGVTVLTKSINPPRIFENGQIFDFELNDSQMDRLAQLDLQQRSYWDNSMEL